MMVQSRHKDDDGDLHEQIIFVVNRQTYETYRFTVGDNVMLAFAGAASDLSEARRTAVAFLAQYFHWGADQIKNWHNERCRLLRQQLSELQREQWQSPLGALPSRFGAPSYPVRAE
jgi:hypothetical protein